MTECPVCGAVAIGNPEVCDDCGTPMTRASRRSGIVSRVLSLLLPGMSHLWRGHLLKGGLGLFGSFLFLFWLGQELRYYTADTFSWIRLVLWVVFWSTWSIGWYWHRLRSSTRWPSPGRIVSSILILLGFSNVFMFVLIIQALSVPMF